MNNTNCNNIPKLLAAIDCKIAETGNYLYNNMSYLLNNNSDICNVSKLIIYKRILLYKLNNPIYLNNWNLCIIGDEVRKLTVGCINKCFKPEHCYQKEYEQPNISIIIDENNKIYTKQFNNIFM